MCCPLRQIRDPRVRGVTCRTNSAEKAVHAANDSIQARSGVLEKFFTLVIDGSKNILRAIPAAVAHFTEEWRQVR
jgi:hypothetical protein